MVENSSSFFERKLGLEIKPTTGLLNKLPALIYKKLVYAATSVLSKLDDSPTGTRDTDESDWETLHRP